MVAKPCAMIDGWYRRIGVSTLVPIVTRCDAYASAPSHVRTSGACPDV